jgi:type II protein arginine methyltransferase
MPDDVEKMIETFEAAIRKKPDYAFNLVGLAEIVAKKGAKPRAAELVRRALAAAPDDPRVVLRGRAALHGLIPGYHVPMMNDARRNVAWDRALRRAIRPGMHVFEIGTGAGMLAMMAARAGAERVTTCERKSVSAMLARELAQQNGLADRIHVVTKHSQEVAVGTDNLRSKIRCASPWIAWPGPWWFPSAAPASFRPGP